MLNSNCEEPTLVLDSSTESICLPEYDFVPENKEYRIRLFEKNDKSSYLSYNLKKGKRLPYRRDIQGKSSLVRDIWLEIPAPD